MASKSDYRSIVSDIRKGVFAPVYLLMGEETYYIDKIEEALSAKVVPEDERDFNMSIYYGQDVEINTVIASCQQYPFMSDHRLIMLKEAQSIPHNAKGALERFADYLNHPTYSNILVVSFRGDELKATSKIVKAAQNAGGVVFRSPRLKDYMLATPIKEYCASKKVGISESAVTLLVEYIGAPLSKLFGEIDKLIAGNKNKALQITPELIEQNIGISKDFNNIELQKALVIKDYDKAMQIIKYFESNPKNNPTVVTTGFLFAFFSKLVAAHFSADKSDAGLLAAIGSNNKYALSDYRTAMSKYSAMQALNAIHSLRDFDRKSKGIGSFQKEYELLKELIFNLFTR